MADKISVSTALPSRSGLSHLYGWFGHTRALMRVSDAMRARSPSRACSRYGPCLDVVDAASRTSNCFTKAYGDYLKGTGPVLRTAHADPAAAAAAIGDADGDADGGADAARRDVGESEPESAERRKRKADALVPAMPREKSVRSNFSRARCDAHVAL